MERSLGNYSNKTKMIINNKEDVFVKICQEISKSKDKVDICIKTTNDFSISSFANKFLMDIIDEIKRNTKIKTRCIVNVPQGNTNYIKQLVSLVDEVRYSHGIKDCFFINKLTYLGISINPKSQHKLHLSPQLIIIKTKSFINQQQFFFDLLWNKAIPYGQNIREIKEDKVKDRKISLPIKTEVIQKQKDLFARITEFYKNSNEIKFCSQADGIKLVYNNFFDLHEQVLDRYRKGNHKGVRWITSLNNKKDIRLIKEFIDKGGIEARHIKDLSTNSFALSDNSFLFTIEKLDKAGNNVLYSNDKLYLNHYDMVFENSWKKGIDIHERIKDIEKGHDYIDVDIIPNPQESIKIFGDLFSSATKEILLILSSINDIDRVENHDDFNKCEELISKKNIKFKVLIPSNIELDDKLSHIKVSKNRIQKL